MKTQHTPGPWEFRETVKFPENVLTVFRAGSPLNVVIYKVLRPGLKGATRTRADMRLIAAAPDLLAALEMVVNHPTRQESYVLARAAIAAATGK